MRTITKCLKPLGRNKWLPQQTKLCSELHCEERGGGKVLLSDPFSQKFRQREREREPIPVRGNKLRDDKPFSIDDEATEDRGFLNL